MDLVVISTQQDWGFHSGENLNWVLVTLWWFSKGLWQWSVSYASITFHTVHVWGILTYTLVQELVVLSFSDLLLLHWLIFVMTSVVWQLGSNQFLLWSCVCSHRSAPTFGRNILPLFSGGGRFFWITGNHLRDYTVSLYEVKTLSLHCITSFFLLIKPLL
jgi:hypothetical protein